MKNTLETRLGIFVALAVIAAVLILETVGGVERFRRGYHLNALFNTVQELKEGDRVVHGADLGAVQQSEKQRAEIARSPETHLDPAKVENVVAQPSLLKNAVRKD